MNLDTIAEGAVRHKAFLRDLDVATAPVFRELAHIQSFKSPRITFDVRGNARVEVVAHGPEFAQAEAQLRELIEHIKAAVAKEYGIDIAEPGERPRQNARAR